MWIVRKPDSKSGLFFIFVCAQLIKHANPAMANKYLIDNFSSESKPPELEQLLESL
jgi:hypothetical protein